MFEKGYLLQVGYLYHSSDIHLSPTLLHTPRNLNLSLLPILMRNPIPRTHAPRIPSIKPHAINTNILKSKVPSPGMYSPNRRQPPDLLLFRSCFRHPVPLSLLDYHRLSYLLILRAFGKLDQFGMWDASICWEQSV